MLVNRIYYVFKPFLPWGVRTAMRRMRGQSRRKAFADVWPIDPKAGATPPGWPGWPDRKQFAVVLTHDVEGNKGIARVEELMKLEAKYGYRSSFNFVPEREYRLSDKLRKTIESAGFEVGVHGLKHDGKLYSSKAEFASRAARIVKYAQQWGACGFRSPLMQHKLSWLHLLGMDYDASTFDTDPFEPEPDGVGTIFPFWVPGPEGTGYVELPYTLVQDFSLFVVLCETNIDLWKKKVDWIAERGGMVLLNTHPDYMCFNGGKPERDEFPVTLYEELLRYLNEKYEGRFWRALPREVSEYYRAAVPESSRNSRKKICMVAYTGYENDSRVRRYAEALVKRGDQVEVIALAGAVFPLGSSVINGVTVHRIQIRELNERHKWTYAWRLLRFLTSTARFLARRHREVKFDLIHVHNMPDFLVYSAWYPKWSGSKVILDIHDVMPELFANKFSTEVDNRYVKFLKWVEKASCKFADHVIVSNHLWRDLLVERSVSKNKCSVFVNHVDPALFYRRSRQRDDKKLILLFPGSFQWHQGLDIAIAAMGHLKEKLPQAELHLYGGGSPDLLEGLAQLVKRLDLEDRVKFCGGVVHDQMPQIVANADVGVVPKRADSFGNEAYSTKIMEFMSQGVPTVVSRTKIDSFYFDDSMVRFFTSGDSQALADAVLDVVGNPSLRQGLITHSLAYADKNSWDGKRSEYLKLVDTLTTENFAGISLTIGADVNPAKVKSRV